MRKVLLYALMTALLLGTASCGKRESLDGELRDIQQSFQEAERFRFVAELRADYGEKVYDFRVRFEGSPEAGTVTILEPSSVAGAAVRFDGSGTALSYDGAEIYTGELLPEGLSPVDALPMMTNAWREGLVTGIVREKYSGADCLAAVFMLTEDTELRTWFENGIPVYAEVSFDGYTVLTASFFDVIAE